MAAAWSIVVGGIVQLIVILFAVYRKKHMPAIQMPKSDKDINKFFKNLIPAIMGSGVTQINIWIGTIIATSIPGAVSIIYYADRIVQLPLSLIGVSIGIVVLPKLSRMFKAQQKTKAIFLQNRSIELALALSMPCSVALYLIAEPIIYMLFQRGEFNLSDTAKTTPALIILGLGIPAYVLNKIIVSSYFANEDTKTPVKISAFTVLVNVIGNLILVKNYSYVGITAATAAAAWINIFLLIFFAQKKQIFEFDRVFKFKLMKIIISCIFMYIFVESIFGLLDKYLYSDKVLVSILSFAAIIFGAFFIYLLSIFATRTYTIRELKSLYFEN
jgi:putative peptidoglycan lipid II flippase